MSQACNNLFWGHSHTIARWVKGYWSEHKQMYISLVYIGNTLTDSIHIQAKATL